MNTEVTNGTTDPFKKLEIKIQEQDVRIRELEIIEQEMEYLETEYGKVKLTLEGLYRLFKILSLIDVLLATMIIIHVISMII